ncbi:MAG: gliding motility-associated C-terminal domain-containing protein [Flavobacteriales bacterium]|nr:gliding motility-associated C-terminal domain-containing protein [Flavobacteriales bacterium]
MKNVLTLRFLIFMLCGIFFRNEISAQTYTMSTANNGTTINTCSGTVYDPGGTGAYGNSQNMTLTFCPSSPGQLISINFTTFDTESGFDFVTVFAGIGTGGATLMGPLSGGPQTPNPNPVVSNAANGCITIRFTSDGSVTDVGFVASISCTTAPSCTDGIQNGLESGVDCGGCSTCPPCAGAGANNATVTASSNIVNLPCGGGNVNLSAVGVSTQVELGSNFNGQTPGPGWSVSPAGVFTNPCGPGPNGAHMWMGNTTAAPRTLQTAQLDLSCGGQICFWLRYAVQGGTGSCEGPDEPDEGVNLQFSTNCGVSYSTIAYFHPNGTVIAANPGTNTPSTTGNTAFTSWAQYCFTIPAGAMTDHTIIQWYQSGSSGTCCDHWGIDEVVITSNSCTPYYYDWTHVAGAPNSANVTTNVTQTTTFTVHYTNGINDTATANVTVVVAGPGTPTVATTTEPCLGTNQGSATITAVGGTPPFTYSIAGPVNSSNGTGVFNNLPPGNYTATVAMTGPGCSSTTNFTIVPGPTCCTTTATGTNMLCNASCTGTATANPSGGQAPYSFSWAQGGTPIGQNTQTASNLCAGTYTVTVTDATGCTATASYTVTQPTALTGSATQVGVTCFGLCTGSVTVTANGGTPTYTYSIDGGAFQAGTTFNGLCAGPHIVTIKDANGCTTTVNITVTTPTALSGSITANIPATCGGSNGSFTAAGSGGTSPYQYSINGTTFQASGTFASLAPGSYTVTIRDANNCTTTIPVTITNQGGPVASVNSITNVSCAGGVNGQVIISGAGGTPPLSYDLNPGPGPQASNTFSGLAAGNYTVVVSDANNCTTSVPVTITQPTQLTFTSVVANVTCNGQCNGQITITANNATPPYQYSSNGGLSFQPSNVLANLCAGTVNVVVRDANGCLANANVVVTQPAALNATYTPVNPLCQGVCNGQINVATNTGGTPAYQFSVDGGALQSSTNFSGLCGGPHSMIIQDANGCTATANVTLVDPPGYSIDTVYTDPSNCGFNDGGFQVIASGGNSPYVYVNLTAGMSDPNGEFLNLVAGAYEIQVTDALGCVETTFVGINDIQMSGQFITSTDPTCPGICDGSVSTIATGGFGTITYDLDNGAQTQPGSGDFVGLCDGAHAVVMVDQGQCVYVVPFTLTAPGQIFFTSATTPVTCNGGTNGTISIGAPTGGTPPFQYSINGGTTYQASPNFAGLAAGTYNLSVQDANGCSATGTATITQPTAVTFTTNVTDLSCNGNNTGVILIVAAGGTPGYTYSNDNGVSFGPGLSFFGLAAGTYNVVVKDNAGCTVTNPVVVNQPAVLTITTVADSVDCNGSCDGSITVTGGGGTTPYLYSQDNGVTFSTNNIITNLCAGSYNVQIKDDLGCTVNTTQVVAEPTAVSATVATVNSTCGLPNGSLTITASNGTPGYQYSIDGGTTFQASSTFNALAAQTYNIVVEDQYGCQFTTTATVNNDASPVINILMPTDPLCNGDANGQIEVTATGGTGALQYSVDGGANQSSTILTGLMAGNHTVVVTDANGCTDTDNITLNEPAVLSLNGTPVDLTCFNDFSGSVSITGNGGTSPYQYSFDGGTTYGSSSSMNFIAAGTYNISIQDNHGCVANATAVVNQPTQLQFQTFVTVNATCNGVCDGQVQAFPQGGTVSGLYNFNWSGGIAGNSQASATGLCAGTYNVIITDDNGCMIDSTFTITEPNPVVITNVIGTDALCAGSCDGTITITAPTATQYSVDGGATFVASNIFNGLCLGNYDIMVQDATGCEATSNITIYEPLPLTLSGTPDAFICYAGDMTLSSLAQGGTAPYNYSWSNGVNQQNQIVNPTVQTTYSVSVTDANGCTAGPVSTVVSVSPLFYATISQNDTICPGESTVLTAQGFDGQPAYVYEWSTNDTTASITVTPTGPTTYTMVAKDQCGDYDTLTVVVDFYTIPQVNLSADNLNGCSPVNVNFTNTTPAGQVGSNCTWNFGNGTTATGCGAQSAVYTLPGCYDVSLTVTSPEGCVGDTTLSNYICVFENPIADFTWNPLQPTILDFVVNFNDQSYNAAQWNWDFASLGTSTNQNPSFAFANQNPGDYLVCLEVTSPDGCIDDTCKYVTIYDEYLLYVPNAFTPDGDGINDEFLPIVNGVDPDNYEFMIFDRWGELIFQTDVVGKAWPGTYKAKDCQQDVYVWKIKARDLLRGDQKVYYGHVSLLR